jgi:menaquinone-dependent protoporphyrinogen oxidase
MSGRVLVAYATRLGSTIGVAETIGQALRETGADVEVLPVADVVDLTGYDAIVLGSAIRVGKPLPELIELVRQCASDPRDLPVAYFAVCATMKDDSPEHRATVLSYLDPLQKIKESVSIGLFAGAFEYERVNLLLRWFLKVCHAPEGDWRDWNAIRAWAADLAPLLTQARARQVAAGADTSKVATLPV